MNQKETPYQLAELVEINEEMIYQVYAQTIKIESIDPDFLDIKRQVGSMIRSVHQVVNTQEAFDFRKQTKQLQERLDSYRG